MVGARSVWEDLADFAVRLSAAATLEDVLHALTDHGLRILGSAGCGLVTKAPDGGWELVLATSFGSELRSRSPTNPTTAPCPRAGRPARGAPTWSRTARRPSPCTRAWRTSSTSPAAPGGPCCPARGGRDVRVAGRVLGRPAPVRRAGEDPPGGVRRPLRAVPAPRRVPAPRGPGDRARRRAGPGAAAGGPVAPAGRRGSGPRGQLPARAGGREHRRDWYDVLTRSRGDLLLAIGDVAGHDARAAAAMTRLRTMLRGLAWDSDDGPARLLDRLDALVAALEPGTLATAVVATATVEPDGALDVRWANAGHPPPRVRPSGRRCRGAARLRGRRPAPRGRRLPVAHRAPRGAGPGQPPGPGDRRGGGGPGVRPGPDARRLRTHPRRPAALPGAGPVRATGRPRRRGSRRRPHDPARRGRPAQRASAAAGGEHPLRSRRWAVRASSCWPARRSRRPRHAGSSGSWRRPTAGTRTPSTPPNCSSANS